MTNNCQVVTVDFTQFTVLVQYIDASNNLQRCWLPRGFFTTSRKNQPVNISCSYLSLGITYSDVDLELTLGKMYKTIQIRDLEQKFRKAGLWLREDYRKNPDKIKTILRQNKWHGIMDVTTILNAVHMAV